MSAPVNPCWALPAVWLQPATASTTSSPNAIKEWDFRMSAPPLWGTTG